MAVSRVLARLSRRALRLRGLSSSTSSVIGDTDASREMAGHIHAELEADHVEVMDVSGGCGSMYQVLVVASRFEGLPLVRQHGLVTSALEEHIKDMHGLTVKTMTPSKFEQSRR